MKKLLWSIIIVMLFPAALFPQAWQRVFGSEELTNMRHQDLPNGAIGLADGSVLIKVGQTGNQTEAESNWWYGKKIKPEIPVTAPTPLGWGFVMKVTRAGNREWMKVLYPDIPGLYNPANEGWQSQYHIAQVSPTSDGGFLAGGWTPLMQKDDFAEVPFILRYDRNGNKTWEAVYKNFREDKFSRSGVQVVGETKTGVAAIIFLPDKKYILLKADSKSGNTLSTTEFPAYSTSSATIQGSETRIAQSGEIFNVECTSPDGRIKSPGEKNIYVTKYSPDGTLLWRKEFGGDREDGLVGTTNLTLTREGGAAFCAYSLSFGPYRDYYAACLDRNGNTLWSGTYGRPGFENWACGIVQTSDGGFAIGGTAAKNGSQVMLFVKLNAAGTKAWEREIKNDDGNCYLAPSKDGGFYYLGYTYLRGSAGGDTYVVKFDAKGNIDGEGKRALWRFDPKK